MKVWRWEKDTAKNLIRFTCESPAGESGYPGNLKVSVIYQLTDTNKLIIKYEASTDSPTHVNLTNHAYFNLGACPNIHQHKLRLEVDRYTPVNHSLIPTGDISDIPGSLDFRIPSALGEKIHQRETLNEQGLDHNLVFTNHDGTLRLQGDMVEPVCGRTLSLATTEPAVQVYTANHLDGILGKHRRIYDKHSGVCLETQHYPDSPNQPTFPSTVLAPDEVFESTTVFQFGVLN